jgi:hypothetical protein
MFYRIKQCPGLGRYIFGVAQFCQGKSPIFQHTASFFTSARDEFRLAAERFMARSGAIIAAPSLT